MHSQSTLPSVVSYTVVEIGFQMENYIVRESEGFISVDMVMTGSISPDRPAIEVTLSTENGTAIGTKT